MAMLAQHARTYLSGLTGFKKVARAWKTRQELDVLTTAQLRTTSNEWVQTLKTDWQMSIKLGPHDAWYVFVMRHVS